MTPEIIVRDAIEGLLVFGLGAMIAVAVVRLAKGQIKPNQCDRCERPFSRVYAHCPHCGLTA